MTIGKASTGKGFGGLSRYLLNGADGKSPQRVQWTELRNLPYDRPEDAARSMEATAAMNTRVQKPVYHLSISWPEDEQPTQEQMREAADHLMRDLRLSDHQALLVAHNDTKHPHVHIMVNRVHPETLKTWDNKHDRRRIRQSLRQIEFKMGWRLTPGRTDPIEKAPPGRAEIMRANARHILLTAKNWRDLEERLQRQVGYTLRARGRGLVITDGLTYVKASSVDRSVSRAQLEKRFRMDYSDWRKHLQQVQRIGRRCSRRGGSDLAWVTTLKRTRRQPKEVVERLRSLKRRLQGKDDLRGMQRKIAAFAVHFGTAALAQVSPHAAAALTAIRITKRILDRQRERSR